MAGIVAASLGGCANGLKTASTGSPSPSSGACAITVPNGSTPPGEAPNAFHHGNGKLFTVLYGTVMGTPENTASDGSIHEKFPWWRGDGVVGKLRLEGTRIDAPAPPLRTDFQDYGDTGFQATSLIFPAVGCWQITAHAGDAELTVIQSVAVAPQ